MLEKSKLVNFFQSSFVLTGFVVGWVPQRRHSPLDQVCRPRGGTRLRSSRHGPGELNLDYHICLPMSTTPLTTIIDVSLQLNNDHDT